MVYQRNIQSLEDYLRVDSPAISTVSGESAVAHVSATRGLPVEDLLRLNTVPPDDIFAIDCGNNPITWISGLHRSLNPLRWKCLPRRRWLQEQNESFILIRLGWAGGWRGDMRISPVFVQLRGFDCTCLARCIKAVRDKRSRRPRRDFNLRYCWIAAR